MSGTRAVALALALAASVGLEAQDAVFSAKVEAVRVDVLVTASDKGPPILGLGPSDFEVFDNGVAQEVDLVSFEQIPLNVILALDMSDSVAGERLDQLRAASDALLGGLKEDDQAALITFSHQVVLGAPLATDRAAIRRGLANAAGSGATSLIDGTFAGIMLGESDVGRGLLIVFSDGVDTASWLSAAAVLDAAKRSDIVVYGVALQSRVKPQFLIDLASLTGGRVHEIDKTNLTEAFVSILDEFRVRYLVSYTPRGVEGNGWHRLDVNVKGRKATIHARPGYLAGS